MTRGIDSDYVVVLAGGALALLTFASTVALALRARRRNGVRSLIILAVGLRILASAPGVMFFGSLAALAMTRGQLRIADVKAIRYGELYWLTRLTMPAILCWGAAFLAASRGLGADASGGSLPLHKRFTGVALSAVLLVGLWCFDPWVDAKTSQAYSEIVQGTSPIDSRAASVPTIVSALRAVDARQIALGDGRDWANRFAGLAIDSRGKLWRFSAWATAETIEPVALPFAISSASQYERSVCALSIDGRAACWHHMDPSTIFFPFPGHQELRSIEAFGVENHFSYCAISAAGEGRCLHGSDSSEVEVDSAFDGLLTALTARFGGLGCAAIRDGGVDCWILRNDHSRLKRSVLGAKAVVFVASTEEQACAIQTGGELVCWGESRIAQLNLDAARPELQARPVLPGRRVRHVAVCEDHICAVVDAGEVFCWGENEWGQLGDGSTQVREGPVRARGIEDAVSVAVERAATCAVHATGAVSCWGMRQRFGGG